MNQAVPSTHTARRRPVVFLNLSLLLLGSLLYTNGYPYCIVTLMPGQQSPTKVPA